MLHKPTRFVQTVIGHPEKNVPVITTKDWFSAFHFSPKKDVPRYVLSLFPVITWIGRYNLGWLSRDLIAGITVGIVVIPQSMSYAVIATLTPEYGLYSAFVGVMIYCFFATSKDVSIGPVAVMSLTIAQIIKAVNEAHPGRWENHVIATTISFICGFITLGIGLLRLGWIVEFIPAPAVSGFMTGSAISIVSGQVPGLLGITGFDTRAATYKVIINTFKFLPNATKDAAFGVPALVTLYAIRWFFEHLTRKHPHRARLYFYLSILRNGVMLVLLTFASWLYVRHRRDAKGNFPIRILKDVPRGFQKLGAPPIDKDLVSALASHLPVATVILLLEHIAIAKSFGRINGYKINPNQELIAMGVTNTIASVFNAYAATGSFSRSALKSKCGVRTPIAGVFTGVVVVVALYGLTSAFYFIPMAGLSAIIIHAVADLVAKPSQVYAFWLISPLEFIIWAATVLIMIFSTIETGIYTSIIASLVLMLIRIAHPRGNFLGKVRLHADGHGGEEREVFVPLKQKPGSEIEVASPIPGVIVYRHEESLVYPNSSIVNSALVDYIKEHTRRGKDMSGIRQSDRPWNDPGPKPGHEAEEYARDAAKPLLRAVVLDFSSVSQIDTTGVQALVDTRSEAERWADREVEFHFSTLLSPWIRRALVAGGFGIGIPSSSLPREVASVVPYRELDAEYSKAVPAPPEDVEAAPARRSSAGSSLDEKGPRVNRGADLSEGGAVDTPFFHFDLESAVRAAEIGALRAGGATPPETPAYDKKS